MKNKTLAILLIGIITFINLNTTSVFANSINNNGINFIGEVTTTKKYYDGDALLRDDIILNGYCVDENNNPININSNNIFIPSMANIDNREYIIHDNGKNCSGVINIDIKSFNSTVNYDEFYIEPINFNKDNKLDDIRQSAKVYLWNQLERINFYNNIGNKLDVNYEKVTVDTSVIQLESGKYNVPYEVNFYTKNLKKENVYNSVQGTFEVVVGTDISTENETLMMRMALFEEDIATPSLTATDLVLGLNTTFDININNKVIGSKYVWSSFNPKVATVDIKNGVVTPISKGDTIISCVVTLPDGSEKFLDCKVIVGYDEETPVLSEDALDLEIGDIFRLKVNNLLTDSEVSWKSSNKNIVKVTSKTGKATAISTGEAYITCAITVPETNQIIILRCDVSVE